MVSKGQIVGIDWNRIARLRSHMLAHMNSVTASRCHINASHMNSLTASRRHIKTYQDASNRVRVYVSPRIYVISYTECKYGGPLGRPGTSSMEARPVSM